MSLDEFYLFSTYLYLFGNKHIKSKLHIFTVFLMLVCVILELLSLEFAIVKIL